VGISTPTKITTNKIEKVFSPTCVDWQITNNYIYLFDIFFVMKVNPLGKRND